MKMNRIIPAILTIFIATALVSAGTFAYFSDTETSTGNTFTAGTMDLKLKNGDEDWEDGVKATWTLSNMKPGDTRYGYLDLKNVGTISADHLEITCDYTITETPNVESDTNWSNTPDDLAKQMNISKMQYLDSVDINLLDMLSDSDGDGHKTLYDLKHVGIDDIKPPPGIGDANKKQVSMTLEFLDHPKNNDFQGDTLTVTFTFTLNQHSSQ
jgi:predicted ribosomally synthesized peptide with SipW-like signal peptide